MTRGEKRPGRHAARRDGPQLWEKCLVRMKEDGQTKGQKGSRGVLLGHAVKQAAFNCHTRNTYQSPGDGQEEVKEMNVGRASERKGRKIGKESRCDYIIP